MKSPIEYEEEITILQSTVVSVQSRSYEIISQVSSERDLARNVNAEYETIFSKFATTLGLDSPTVAEVVSDIAKRLEHSTAPVEKTEPEDTIYD